MSRCRSLIRNAETPSRKCGSASISARFSRPGCFRRNLQHRRQAGSQPTGQRYALPYRITGSESQRVLSRSIVISLSRYFFPLCPPWGEPCHPHGGQVLKIQMVYIWVVLMSACPSISLNGTQVATVLQHVAGKGDGGAYEGCKCCGKPWVCAGASSGPELVRGLIRNPAHSRTEPALHFATRRHEPAAIAARPQCTAAKHHQTLLPFPSTLLRRAGRQNARRDHPDSKPPARIAACLMVKNFRHRRSLRSWGPASEGRSNPFTASGSNAFRLFLLLRTRTSSTGLDSSTLPESGNDTSDESLTASAACSHCSVPVDVVETQALMWASSARASKFRQDWFS